MWRHFGAAALVIGLGAGGWDVRPVPVWEGPLSVVGDPSVLRQDGGYAMYHHCLDVLRDPQGGEVCLAASPDGVTWTAVETPLGSAYVPGRVLSAGSDGWNAAHETPFAVRPEGTAGAPVWVVVLGYRGAGFRDDPRSAGLGIARGDGRHFGPLGPPVLTPGPGPDAAGFTSPSLVATPQGWLLYYTGWACAAAMADCQAGRRRWDLTLMAVPLDSDGRVAGPRVPILGDPGLADPALSWTQGGISETEVARGPDGRYYLFFSTLPGALTQRIGMGVAEAPLGPFRLHPVPIVVPEPLGPWANGGVMAPSVVFEADRVRLWFHGFEVDATGAIRAGRIGLAEHPWPPP